jgi:hypothetical protein
MDLYRGRLPIPEKKFEGTIGRTAKESKPDKPAVLDGSWRFPKAMPAS